MAQSARRRPNAGWFRRGPDPRRHALTAEERRRGGLTWLRLYYMGGTYATYLGQLPHGGAMDAAEEAIQAGDGDRPGRPDAN